MSLSELEESYLKSSRSPEELEDMIQEELDELLDENTVNRIREEIEDLDSEEFRDIVRAVLDEL